MKVYFSVCKSKSVIAWFIYSNAKRDVDPMQTLIISSLKNIASWADDVKGATNKSFFVIFAAFESSYM